MLASQPDIVKFRTSNALQYGNIFYRTNLLKTLSIEQNKFYRTGLDFSLNKKMSHERKVVFKT